MVLLTYITTRWVYTYHTCRLEYGEDTDPARRSRSLDPDQAEIVERQSRHDLRKTEKRI